MTDATITMNAATGIPSAVYQASSAAQIAPAETSAFETTFFGATISGMITDTAHVWTANASGLFSTTADLATEWQNAYSAMMANDASTLTFIQRLEGNAEAVFENAGIAKLDTATQARDRMDVQREFDAIGVAMNELGLDPKAALTTQNYLAIENTIISDPSLEELAFQGHGLNDPSVPKYDGYTNDFQNNVDNTTLYIGGGLNNNQNAVADFFDDDILTHIAFPTVAQNGQLQQLNQNGAAENTLSQAVGAIDQFGAGMVLTAADFSATPGTASSTPETPPDPAPTPLPAGQMLTLFGATISTTQIVNGHTWVAGPSGLFETSANLAAEWQSDYQMILNGQSSSMTAIQRLEGNAEAVFLNTGLATLGQTDYTQLSYDMMDAQRQIDALAGIMTALGLGSAPLTDANYLAIQHALQNNPAYAALEQLAIEGHGLNGFSSEEYAGYTNDFQTKVDNKTLYVGPGLDSGERAVTNYFDDAILTHFPFPTVAQNGELIQLNQNGKTEDTLQAQVAGLNQSLFSVVTAADFSVPGGTVGGAAAESASPPTTTTTFFGATIPATMAVNGHVWTVGPDGKFHTTTDLATEWETYYQMMLNGQAASMTPVEREEGNAEAAFENTGLDNPSFSAAQEQKFREDAQREFDAVAATMTTLGLGANPLSEQDYLNIEQSLQANAALEELAMQGHGLNDPPSSKYNGYTNDFQNNIDGSTFFVGGGLDNGENALADFFDDIIMTHLPFPTVSVNGTLEQLNQNANDEDVLAVSVAEANDSMFLRVYVAGDFSKNASTVGPVDYVMPADAMYSPPPPPTPGAGQMLSLTGAVISTTIVANGHTWTADAQDRYETSTDLTLEWYNDYQMALAGDTLTLSQQWEAQAESVFLNTALDQQSEGQQEIDRADVQREIDAVVSTMDTLGLGSAPLTDANYLAIGQALAANAALEELAIQGHGLNNPYVAGVTEYNGYTNDFQNNIDGKTLYVGGGLNTGERAVADFFDDNILSHLPFPVVAQNGELEQLNQNGNAENTLNGAVAALNATLFGPLYTAADFMTPGKQGAPAVTAGPATITTLYGDTIAGTMTINGDVWTADVNGTFQTSTNLEMQWRTYYQIMLAGNGASLTPTERLEANAEAMFENTNIDTQWMGAAKEEADREDVQREIDAIAAAMQTDQTLYGIDPNAPLTEASYLQLAQTIQDNPVLQELALQGHGLANPPSVRYRGAYGDFMSTADWSTYFVGGGPDNGLLALPYAFNDIITNLAFPTVFVNGQWQQLNMNGSVAETVIQAATALNDAMDVEVFVPGDFSTSAATIGPVVLVSPTAAAAAAPISSIVAPAGHEVTLSGQVISTTLIENGHTWTADANGLFHTSNLAAEWIGYETQMLARNANSLTPFQRAEGNAEAVFEATGLTKLSAAAQQQYREDVQRELDAMATAATITAAALNIPTTAVLLPGSYVPLERTLHDNAALEELAVQGFGLNNPPPAQGSNTASTRYGGYVNGFRNLSSVKYVGTGINSGKNALSVFMGENIMSFTPFAVIWLNGKLTQLSQNGQTGDTLANAIQATDDTLFNKVYAKTDFH